MGMKRILHWALAGIVGLTVAVLIFGLFLFHSSIGSNVLRSEITQKASQRYGAKVQIGALTPHLIPLSLDLREVTVGSQDSSASVPFFYARRVLLGIRIFPLFREKLELSRVILDEPVARLRINAEGQNNFSFRSAHTSRTGSNGPQTLFDMKIGDCAIRAGEVFYNNAEVPLSAEVHNLRLAAAYSQLSGEYKGSLAYDRGIWSEAGLGPIPHSLELNFDASPSTLFITALRLTSGASDIALRGNLSNYSDPVIDASYQANIAMPELATILRQPALPSGKITLEGTLAYHGQPSHSLLSDLNLQGKLRTNELAVSDVHYRVTLVDVSGSYALNNANLELRDIAAKVLGGVLKASADFDKIDTPSPAVRLDASLQKLSLVRLNDTLAPSSVQRIPLEGLADLRAQALWTGPFSHWANALMASGRLSISAPNQPVSAQVVPLNGSIVVNYNAPQNVLTFDHSHLQTRDSRISISGTLAPKGTRNASIAIKAGSENINEVASLAVLIHNAVNPSAPLAQPPGLAGSAKFEGSATGTLEAPLLDGALTGQMLSFADTHWRSARADLAVSPSELRVRNASLAGNSREQITFSGETGLHNWSVTAGSPISVHASASGITIPELSHIARLDEPLAGVLTANVSVTGTRASPEGTASVTVANGSAWNEPFTKLLVNGNFHQGGLNSTVNLQLPAGAVSASIDYTLATRGYALQLQGMNLELDRISALKGRNIRGSANIEAEGRGTLTDPKLEANLNVPVLEAQGQTVSNIAASVNVTGRNADFTLHSAVDQGSVEGTGDVILGGDYYTQAKLDIEALPVAAVAADFIPAQTSKIGGQTQVHLTFRGPLSDPGSMEAHLQVPNLNLTFGGAQMALVRPLEANYQNRVLTISNSKIQGTGTNLTFGGTVSLKNSPTYSLMADGSVDLGVLHQFVPGVQSQGEIDIHIASQGSTSQPSMRGQLEVKNAAFSSETFPVSFEGLNGAIALSGDRAVITHLSGSVGGGNLTATGSLDFGREKLFALAVNAQSVRIRYPTGLRSVLNAQLNAQGTPGNSSLTGRVTVDSLSFTQMFDLATFLNSFSGEATGSSPSAFERRMKLSVVLQSAQNVSLASSRLSVSGSANLNVIGTLAQPVLLGRVALTSGEVFYLGKRFELQNGTVEFANPARTDPLLNLYIGTKVEQYDLTLKLRGPVDRLQTSYTSEPPMSQADIIHLLAFGNTTAEAAAMPASASQSAEAVLAQGVSDPLTGKLQSITGITQLSIDPLATNAYGDPGAQIAIQERVTGNILFTFSTNVTTTQNQAAALQYDFSKHLSVTILRDQNGGYGVDVRVRKAF